MWKWRLELWDGPKLIWSGLYESKDSVMKRLCSQRFIEAARRAGATEWDFRNEQHSVLA